ncbi:hypothetical protein AB1Y20_007096 [Prymnesium parvum]|uniref:Sugar phosphate transporter domain-containing protein n=1 Tax=Prymnesium parvum TaxID=97485 RepID=A0AB34J073_PRYPA
MLEGVRAAYLIVQWIFFSSCIILFNKYLLDTAGFHFPLTLVLLHMVFISACTLLFRLAGWEDIPFVSWRDIGLRFVPVGICFALSLGLGNAAYLYISVAFIQMIKASTPVAVLLVSFALRLEKPNGTLVACILIISAGIFLACATQVELSSLGLALQMLAVIAEALRLGLVNLLLTSRGVRFTPVAFLYYAAPLCALALLAPWAVSELPQLSEHRFRAVRKVGCLTLLANASVAFILNLATMALIKHTSALTLNVSGVFKDLLLICYSVLVSGAVVRPVQYVGYAIAVLGVSWYSHHMRTRAPPEDSERLGAMTPLSTIMEEKSGAESASDDGSS